MKGFNLNMILGVIIGLLTIVVTLSMAPSIGTANDALLPSEVIDTLTGIHTGVGITEADATLTEILYHEDIADILDISSNISEGAGPTVDSYDATTQNITVSGLTANTTRTFTVTYDTGLDLRNLIGMEVLTGFGAPLAILGLLAMGGLFTFGAWKGTNQVNMGQIMQIVGITIAVIVGLTFMTSVVIYSNNLIGDVTTDFEDVIYGIIPLFVYLVIVSLPFIKSYASWHSGKKSRKVVSNL